METGDVREAARALWAAAREAEAEGRPAAAATAYKDAIAALAGRVNADDDELRAMKRSCVTLLVGLGRDAEAAALSST